MAANGLTTRCLCRARAHTTCGLACFSVKKGTRVYCTTAREGRKGPNCTLGFLMYAIRKACEKFRKNRRGPIYFRSPSEFLSYFEAVTCGYINTACPPRVFADFAPIFTAAPPLLPSNAPRPAPPTCHCRSCLPSTPTCPYLTVVGPVQHSRPSCRRRFRIHTSTQNDKTAPPKYELKHTPAYTDFPIHSRSNECVLTVEGKRRPLPRLRVYHSVSANK